MGEVYFRQFADWIDNNNTKYPPLTDIGLCKLDNSNKHHVLYAIRFYPNPPRAKGETTYLKFFSMWEYHWDRRPPTPRI